MLAECLERCNSTVRLLGATYDIDAVPRAERLRDALRVLRRYAGKDNGRRKVPGSRRGLDFTVNVVRGKLQHEPGEAKEQLGRRNEVFDLDEGQAPIAGNIAVALPALLIFCDGCAHKTDHNIWCIVEMLPMGGLKLHILEDKQLLSRRVLESLKA